MAEISLCMIVKNEEAVLARCLESVRGAVDEIIIVDTGSDDATKQIAARYTDHIYDFAWRDDFAAARNFSFSKATKAFAMWLDADDILTEADRDALIALKNAMPEDADVIMMKYNAAFDETGRPVFTYYRERLIRRSIDFRWKGRVHEVIVHAGRALYTEIAVTHRPGKKGPSDRNLRIYERQIADGEKLEPREQFYYGRELYEHGRCAQARRVLEDFLASGAGWVENEIEACRLIAGCRQAEGEPSAALRALTESFRYDAPRAEICCEIGDFFMRQAKYRVAAFWYELALSRPRDARSGAFISEDCYGFLPCIRLCVCHDRLGEFQKAEEYNRRAGEYRPASPAYLQNLAYFARLRGTLARASEYLKQDGA